MQLARSQQHHMKMGQWTNKQHILNKDNLTYEHNLILVQKILINKHNTNLLNKYPKKFLHPLPKWKILDLLDLDHGPHLAPIAQ